MALGFEDKERHSGWRKKRKIGPEFLHPPLFRSVCSTGQIHTAIVNRTSLCEILRLQGIKSIAEDPQARVLGQGSDLRPRIGIQVKSEWTQFGSNRCAIHLNCIRTAKNPESSRNRMDCKYGVLDCVGLRPPKRAHFGDCGALRGLQRALKLKSRSALEPGLSPDQQPLG